MFDSFRDKFYSVVQDGINLNNSVRRKISQAQQSPKKSTFIPFIPPETLDYSTGTELLEKYKKEWTLLHDTAEKNAKEAENIDSMMLDIHKNVKKRLEDITSINLSLCSLPKVITAVEDCTSLLKTLSEKFELVESELINLEAVVEKCDFEQRKMEHKFQLHMYKEKKLASLEGCRVRLSEQQAEEVRRAETMHRLQLQERQSEAASAFHQDLTLYKTQGELPRKVSLPKQKEPTLEEIQLDTDDTAEFEDFLRD